MSVTHNQSPEVHVISDGQARGLMRSLIDSRRWWVCPLINEDAIELAVEIERRHYAGAANRDCLILAGPTPVAFYRKSRMPAGVLARLLADLTSDLGWSEEQWRSAVAEQDILVGIAGDAEEGESLMRLTCWHAWLVAA